MKRFFLFIISVFTQIILVAQTQYDYMDDDAVAGGAGHVRRIVTADGQAFQRVLAKAISVVDNCDCDSSCYRCLRNYYNQKIHDTLNRNQASAFLHQWVGNMNPLPVETIE